MNAEINCLPRSEITNRQARASCGRSSDPRFVEQENWRRLDARSYHSSTAMAYQESCNDPFVFHRLNSRPRNRPIERATLYLTLLQTFVIVGSAKYQPERHALKATNAFAAIACSETSDADQPLRPLTFHSAHQDARGFGEKANWPKEVP